MNKIHSTYPLLLTRFEPGTESEHIHSYGGRGDVWKGSYQQGEKIADDTLTAIRKVAAKRHVDENGVGWHDHNTPWILSNHQLQLCQPGQKPQSVLSTQAHEISVSASQRYIWTVEHDEYGSSVKQFDSATTRWQTPWQVGRYECVSLVSDPRQDRLLFFHGTFNVPDQLEEWDPRTSELVALNGPPNPELNFPVLSPDAQKLAFVAADDEVYSYEFSSGKSTRISDLQEENDYCFQHYATHLSPSWSPDGTRIFYSLYSEFWEDDFSDKFAALLVATSDGQQRQALLQFDEGVYAVQACHLNNQLLPNEDHARFPEKSA